MAIKNAGTQGVETRKNRPGRDFWKYWAGQTISNLGSSITVFALPLLVFKLTGSAINLGLSMAVEMLPYLLFGLLIGAWTDRANRKRLMILTDVGRALIIATIPICAVLGLLSVWWIYLVGFIHSTLTIFFESGQFAAIPNLIDSEDLVTANGRIQASYSAAQVVGPLLAGLCMTLMPVAWLLSFDALSFGVSAVTLLLIKASFNASQHEKKIDKSIGRDVIEGLRYVLGHPILRNISLMMALINFVATTSGAQLVLFAETQLHASDRQVGILFTAGSLGVALLALAAGPLRKRWSFSTVALSALTLDGLLIVCLAFTTWFWVAVVLWAGVAGLGILFNINTNSLRQAIVPNHMLGRVMSIAAVLAWSAIPLGSLLGGFMIAWTKNISLVYAVIGGLVTLIALSFAFTPIGHAERYLPAKTEETVTESV